MDTGAKVYGYRVDNVHNETYRMWNGMQRNAHGGEMDIEVIQEEQEGDDSQVELDEDGNPIAGADGNAKKRQRKNVLRFKGNEGEKTLE